MARVAFAVCFVLAFLGVNGFFLYLVWRIAARDHELFLAVLKSVEAKQLEPAQLAAVPTHITPEVLMALAGATVIQLGASVYLIAKFLFEDRA
jgi:hypothetical protein